MRGRDVLTFLFFNWNFYVSSNPDIPLAKEKRTSSTKNAINQSKIAQKWQIRASSAQIFHFPCTFRSDVSLSANNVAQAWKTCKTRKHCKSSYWKSPGPELGPWTSEPSTNVIVKRDCGPADNFNIWCNDVVYLGHITQQVFSENLTHFLLIVNKCWLYQRNQQNLKPVTVHSHKMMSSEDSAIDQCLLGSDRNFSISTESKFYCVSCISRLFLIRMSREALF